ncbi:unnamed protein product [Pleuronectes platessa]|uniref:Uncharacterized protein n=1 Tax=Pleuronectes platessa TaxID=8262 RepID=A0A9N7TM54_PLEPL|nr:unnamed protein product [Pleuronectes platessa]
MISAGGVHTAEEFRSTHLSRSHTMNTSHGRRTCHGSDVLGSVEGIGHNGCFSEELVQQRPGGRGLVKRRETEGEREGAEGVRDRQVLPTRPRTDGVLTETEQQHAGRGGRVVVSLPPPPRSFLDLINSSQL